VLQAFILENKEDEKGIKVSVNLKHILSTFKMPRKIGKNKILLIDAYFYIKDRTFIICIAA
jgi:hypothetical protein